MPHLKHLKMHLLKQRPLWAAVVLIVVLASCKKNDLKDPETITNTTPPVAEVTDAVKDSALSYARDLYLWYTQIPSTFSTKSYSGLDKLMTGIRLYSMEPGFSSAVDRWSFAVKQKEWDDLSSGISGDFGMNVFFMAEGDLRVKSVEKSSPAGIAGIHRGWKIISINGNSNISTGNADFIVSSVWNSSNSNFVFLKPDGNSVSINLTSATYKGNTVLLDTVYKVNSKTIGYLAFNSFLGDTSTIYSDFARIFNRFAAAGVNDLVVDLRYNGGGYVSVQQKMADWLAPYAANGQLMMKQEFNDRYTRYNESSYFFKMGSLNLGRIFFIVSNSTASASELLINNLRPYMEVQLVGPSKTYGKPVGFFPIPVGDSYIFPVSFRSTNKNGEGNYFGGLNLNGQAADGLDKDWGDRTESCLQSAISFITTGTFRQASSEKVTIQETLSPVNKVLDHGFKGEVGAARK
jgi:carboxyl-terminal processing protease